jgi:Spy/CpxP family protein refolding chaperone
MKTLSRTLKNSPAHPLRMTAATLVLAIGAAWSLSAEAAPYGQGNPHHGQHGFGQIERMLDGAGASAEQRSEVQAILQAARQDMRAQHGASREQQAQLMQLLAAPTVDARALEDLRQQMLARHDQASKRQMQALLDASRVLSAEQRQKMATQMAERRAMMERHRSERETQQRPVPR